MRKYEPIWLTLKTHNHVSISAPKEKHPLIIRMVSKEKWQDAEFKKQERWRMKYITYRICDNTIHFSLDYRINDITAKEL